MTSLPLPDTPSFLPSAPRPRGLRGHPCSGSPPWPGTHGRPGRNDLESRWRGWRKVTAIPVTGRKVVGPQTHTQGMALGLAPSPSLLGELGPGSVADFKGATFLKPPKGVKWGSPQTCRGLPSWALRRLSWPWHVEIKTSRKELMWEQGPSRRWWLWL